MKIELTLSLVIVFAILPVAYGETWSLLEFPEMMNGITVTYEICDSLMVDEYTGVVGGCYTTLLSFHDTFYTDFASYLAVSAQTEIGKDTRNELFLIDTRTFEIKNPEKRSQISDSLSRTLFWIGKIANDITLEEGALVSDMKSYFPDGIPLMVQKKVTKDDHIQYVLGYKLYKDSTITITPEIQLPLSAEIYSTTNIHPEPSKIFEFKYVNQHTINDDFSPDSELQNNAEHGIITINAISDDIPYEQDLTHIVTQDISDIADFTISDIIEDNSTVTPETTRGFYDIETQSFIDYPLPEIKNNITEHNASANTSTSQSMPDQLPEIKNVHYGK